MDEMDKERIWASDPAEAKKSIRKAFRAIRNALLPEEVAQGSLMICRRLEKLEEYREADAITGYMAFRNEVDLKYIMSTAMRDGKTVFLPRMEGEMMEFYAVDPDQEEGIIKNSLGIPEPDGTTLPLSEKLREACQLKLLVIMPGLVFDRECRRLGYGGGYYDRYIAELQRKWHSDDEEKKIMIHTVAAAYDLQIANYTLPQEVTDLRPDRIVTESRIYERIGEDRTFE